MQNPISDNDIPKLLLHYGHGRPEASTANVKYLRIFTSGVTNNGFRTPTSVR